MTDQRIYFEGVKTSNTKRDLVNTYVIQINQNFVKDDLLKILTNRNFAFPNYYSSASSNFTHYLCEDPNLNCT